MAITFTVHDARDNTILGQSDIDGIVSEVNHVAQTQYAVAVARRVYVHNGERVVSEFVCRDGFATRVRNQLTDRAARLGKAQREEYGI